MEDLNKKNKYFKAKERVEEIKKFYNNLISYLFFIPFLAFINYWTNGWSYMWFWWAALGWGIGLVFQGAKAYNWNPFFNSDWEERKIKEYMDKDKTSRNNWE